MLGKEASERGSQAAADVTDCRGKAPPVVLTLAGFDPSGGAGITADLQTFAAHGLFGTSAITAITVQSTLGVFEVQPVDTGLLRRTLACLQEDLPPRGIKLGMLGSAEVMETVVEFLRGLGSSKPLVVLDPVLRSSSGRELFPSEALATLHSDLLPLIDWMTPNWSELALLSGRRVEDLEAAEEALRSVGERHPHLTLVATGGEEEPPTDLLRLPDGSVERLEGNHILTCSTHGTGCALSSALLAELVLGSAPLEAARKAKAFVEGALRNAPGLGAGRGPLGLLWPLRADRR